ncbi:uncharacterized protein H6S33_002539 [Morchella sextelata]|uniref:uncharacterized protein n=1 Tax=Morchella sextelata TaxID=1174677 RepID=UPI001D044A65|nr:uncharacterized protein H6S33_002539 [Morchella sextelata]KAH0607505.1 hypothetical protein H6S33_002539 [Morchella sextelata]
MAILDIFLGLLHVTVIIVHLLVAPYTKVEESFNLQATHDILRYGISTTNVTASLVQDYDHFAFPGAVPRTFVGPVVLAGLSKPIIDILGDFVNDQVIVRGVLGLLTALSLILYTRAIHRAYGRTTAIFYTLLQISQFHLPYYASRPLPNTFALILSTAALSFLLPRPVTTPKQRRGTYKLGIYILTFTAVIFRSELAILLFFVALRLLLTRRVSLFRDVIPAGIAGGLVGLAITLTVDSYFWQSHNPEVRHFTTPFLTEKTGLIWPELSGFLYNAIENKSSEWGVSVWHYYFSSSLPKLLLNPSVLLVSLPFCLCGSPTAAKELLIPALGYVAVYSYLPHKEWRFVVYIIPALTLCGALGNAWIWDRRTKNAIYALLAMGTCGSIVLAALGGTGMMLVSSWNYPGGDAVMKLHHAFAEEGVHGVETVHLDTFVSAENEKWNTAIKGVVFDKTENEDDLLSAKFWEDIDWVVTSDVSRVIGKWRIVDSVVGWKGVKVYKPGEIVHVGAIGIGEKEAEDLGLVKESEPSTVWWKRALEDGYGLRENVFKGYWVGARIEEMVWILKKET